MVTQRQGYFMVSFSCAECQVGQARLQTAHKGTGGHGPTRTGEAPPEASPAENGFPEPELGEGTKGRQWRHGRVEQKFLFLWLFMFFLS